ncbi:MAG: Serine/threonine-protein kinase PknB, partial [Planctomycetota bacterium]
MSEPSVNPVRLQLLLDQAMSHPEAERAAFVRRATGGDAALCAAALAQLALQTSSRPKPRFFSRGREAAADTDQRLPAELQGLRVGQRVGDFTLVRFLGKGGMGQVWEARQESLRKHVALKLLLSDRIDDRALELFVREARAGGKCHHPNLVATLSRGEDQGIAWLAQELVADAQTLADALERFRGLDQLPQGYHRQVALLVEKVARGMQAAHDAGVVHRDLKPQNILIGADDEPRVVDFGLARVTGDSVASKTGDFAGTYFYMSPEQVMAKRAGLDHRTDVFSLGVVLYELLTLQRPFLGDTGQQIAQQITTWDPPRADTVRSQCPRDLGVIAEKAMQKASSQRYPSMGALAEDLHRYLSDLPILAKPTGRLERARKWVRRNPTVSATMGSVFAGAVVAVTLAWQNAVLARAEAAAKERAIQNEQRAVASEQVAAQRAEENARLAAAETKAKEQAAQLAAEKGRTVEQFQQVSAVVRLKAAQASQAVLWLSEEDTQGWPAKVESLERWLAGPCAELLAQRPQLEATVAALRQQALPPTP